VWFGWESNVSVPEFWSDLTERAVIYQATLPTLGNWLAGQLARQRPFYVYCGFDPSADSLHIGSLMPVLALRRLKHAGLTPIAVVGGATGMVGDPSFKSQERALLDVDVLASNVVGITAQLENLLEGDAGKDFLIVNNADWIGGLRLIEFLRDIGKYFSVNMMVAKESVRARLEDREQGLSFTEFSYMLLQAYDYLHLFERYGCRLQVGGSDQWGNITAGIDLIRHKHHGEEVHGCTFPLITTANGQKFGKTEKGTVWIDRKRTHPHSLYKYFFHTQDADVLTMLRYFTFLPRESIAALADELATTPHLRTAHTTLAREVTAIVHGRETALACEGLEAAMHADDAEAFETHARTLGLLDPSSVVDEEGTEARLPVAHRPMSCLLGNGLSAVELAVELGLFKSKSDARREISGPNSGFLVGGKQVVDVNLRITPDILGGRRVLLIRRGKQQKRMVCFHD
jgi:tyrosyl-tRNA synthetase